MSKVGFVQNVVMHQSGDMDEFDDYRERNMLFRDRTSRPTRQKRKTWAKALAGAA